MSALYGAPGSFVIDHGVRRPPWQSESTPLSTPFLHPSLSSFRSCFDACFSAYAAMACTMLRPGPPLAGLRIISNAIVSWASHVHCSSYSSDDATRKPSSTYAFCRSVWQRSGHVKTRRSFVYVSRERAAPAYAPLWRVPAAREEVALRMAYADIVLRSTSVRASCVIQSKEATHCIEKLMLVTATRTLQSSCNLGCVASCAHVANIARSALGVWSSRAGSARLCGLDCGASSHLILGRLRVVSQKPRGAPGCRVV